MNLGVLQACVSEIGKMEIANKFTLKITFVNLSLQRDRSPGLKVQSEQAEVQH
jgi:hypothetical protein